MRRNVSLHIHIVSLLKSAGNQQFFLTIKCPRNDDFVSLAIFPLLYDFDTESKTLRFSMERMRW